jgi:hypothetical protein
MRAGKAVPNTYTIATTAKKAKTTASDPKNKTTAKEPATNANEPKPSFPHPSHRNQQAAKAAWGVWKSYCSRQLLMSIGIAIGDGARVRGHGRMNFDERTTQVRAWRHEHDG